MISKILLRDLIPNNTITTMAAAVHCTDITMVTPMIITMVAAVHQ